MPRLIGHNWVVWKDGVVAGNARQATIRRSMWAVASLAAALVAFADPSEGTAAPGDLDTTFSNDGRVITKLGGRDEIARDVAVAPNGKTVAVGVSAPEGFGGNRTPVGFAIARYRRNGRLDSSFARDGTRIDMIGHQSGARAVAIQPDGKIIVAGVSKPARKHPWSTLAVVRYNRDGSRDRSFGVNGEIVGFPSPLAAPGSPEVFDVDVVAQLDGKIVIAGEARSADPIDLYGFIIRLEATGTPDRSFSEDGLIVGPTDGNADIALQPDGRMVAFGVYFCSDCYPGEEGLEDEFDLALARYLPDGSPDLSFGHDGLAVTDRRPGYQEQEEDAWGMELRSDGKIVSAGGTCTTTTEGGGCSLAVSVHNADGSLDTTFGTEGFARSGLPGTFPTLAVQEDSKAILAYTTSVSGKPQTGDFVVLRLAEGGTADAAFGKLGAATTDFEGKRDQVYSAAVTPDGRLVVAGASPSGGVLDPPTHFALARYHLTP